MAVSAWLMMLKKDIRILRTHWLVSAGVTVAVGVMVGIAHQLSSLASGFAAVAGGFLVMANLFVLPANLLRGLNEEMRRAPSLWLQTPQSGWAMLASKVVSSVLGALLFAFVAYLMALWMFRINIGHVTSFLTVQQIRDFTIILNQIPRLGLYVMATLLFFGLYIAMWFSTVYISVRTVRNRLQKFSWLVGVGIVLIATWGLSALESTVWYERLFGWGQFSALSLFSPDLQTMFPIQNGMPITAGHLVFDVIVMAILFYFTGRLIDRHVEV